ncbi:hypothetical protein B0H13DRAFT_1865072 [Mycena leptocephala]|nr:hypothetical protein B0H13DRAFT_1865072 [Mycena leptocephala]
MEGASAVSFPSQAILSEGARQLCVKLISSVSGHHRLEVQVIGLGGVERTFSLLRKHTILRLQAAVDEAFTGPKAHFFWYKFGMASTYTLQSLRGLGALQEMQPGFQLCYNGRPIDPADTPDTLGAPIMLDLSVNTRYGLTLRTWFPVSLQHSRYTSNIRTALGPEDPEDLISEPLTPLNTRFWRWETGTPPSGSLQVTPRYTPPSHSVVVVWRHTPAVEHTVPIAFGAEETDTDSAIIMIFLRGDLPNGPMLFIETVNVNLRTGTHNCLLAARAPYSGFIDKPVICGAFAAVRLDSGYMIINWREKSYFIIRGHVGVLGCLIIAILLIYCPQDSDFRFALIPLHIVVLKLSVNGELQLHLISNDTIGTFFSPTIGLDDAAEFYTVSVEEMPKLHTFHAICTKQSFMGMHIHASPIRDADYRVWIWGANDGLLS